MNKSCTTIVFMLINMFIVRAAYATDHDKDRFTTSSGKKLEIGLIKHGTLMFNYDGNIIYIDPVLQSADYTQLPKADVILITHEHSDHLDAEAFKTIWQDNTLLVSNNNSYQILQKGEFMGNGDKRQVTPYLFVEAVPAYNTTPGREKYHPKHRDNGYVLHIEDLRIYVAGDTEDIEEMKNLKDIDIAFLPVNQPYTMTVEQAARAAKMFNPAILYPYHYRGSPIEKLDSLLADRPQIELRIRNIY